MGGKKKMKYKKYKKKYNKKYRKKDNFPAELCKLDMPKGSKFSPVETEELNIPYYFRESEWRF